MTTNFPAVYENLRQCDRYKRMADQMIDERISRDSPLTDKEREKIENHWLHASMHLNAAVSELCLPS